MLNDSSKFGFDVFSKLPVFEQALYQFPKGPFLEIGCGKNPFLPDYLSMLGPVDCLDHDSGAIEFCQKSFEQGQFKTLDILDLSSINIYGMAMDAHLLHCLDSLESYQKALKNIFRSLKPKGVFLFETMVSHSQMAFEIQFKFDAETHQLYKGERVSRLILPSIIVEEQFLKAGFQIEFFKVQEGLRMIPHDKREEAIPEDPQVLRMIASRPEGA